MCGLLAALQACVPCITHVWLKLRPPSRETVCSQRHEPGDDAPADADERTIDPMSCGVSMDGAALADS
jgi:hypothetical protein